MENYVAAQLQQLGAAAALGGAAGLVYDVLRSARLLDRRDRRLTHLLDGVFAALLGAGLLWLALVVGEGELRLYMVTGMLLGGVVWFCLLSPLLRPVWDFWVTALVETGRLLWSPFALLGRLIKKCAAAVKKYFSFWQKCVTMRVDEWKSRSTQEKPPRQKGGRAMARATTHKKTKKRTSTCLLYTSDAADE